MNRIGMYISLAACLFACSSGSNTNPCQSIYATAQSALTACGKPAPSSTCETTCENQVSNCNANDLTLLGQAQNCIEGISGCLSGSAQAAALNLCLGSDPDTFIMKFSGGCLQAAKAVMQCYPQQ